MTDLHSHVLSGVDDGSPDEATSMAMVRAAAEDGTTVLCCTPHLEAEPGVAAALIRLDEARVRLQAACDAEGVPLRLLPGAEWLLSPELLDVVSERGRLGCGRAFLFELSAFMAPPLAETFVREAVSRGLTPVLAHPERHPALDPGRVDAMLGRLVGAGAVPQLTAGSLTGMFGPYVQRTARAVASRFGDRIVLGSDAHETRTRVPGLSGGLAELERLGIDAAAAAERADRLVLPAD